MTVTTADQVIIGKVSLPRVNGQISLFPLPQSFSWLKHLSAEEMAEFFTELLETISNSHEMGDWTAIDDVLESWKATANISAAPTVAAELEQGLSELQEGQGMSWDALRKELQL
jgi:hypothetical protein